MWSDQEGSKDDGRDPPAVCPCAGLDISKRDAKVCVRVAGTGRGRDRHYLVLDDLTDPGVAGPLVPRAVTCVVMEATSDYWKPFYYLLEDLPGVEVILVNARHVMNLPGRARRRAHG